MEKFSKVLGLYYLKSVAYLFVMEASFEEQTVGTDMLIIPKYYIYFKKHQVQQIPVLKMWLDIAFYIKHFVSLEIADNPMTPYRPTTDIPLKNMILLGEMLSIQQSEPKTKITNSKKKRNLKTIVKTIEKQEEVIVVQSMSVMKRVEEQEKRIIMNLLSLNIVCIYRKYSTFMQRISSLSTSYQYLRRVLKIWYC